MINNFSHSKNALYPWVGQPSIYQFIKEQLDQHGKIINPTLPDEEEQEEGQVIRFAPGALDGVLGHHHLGSADSNDQLKRMIKLIRQQVANPSNKTRRATYLAILDDRVLGYIDPLLQELRMQSDLRPDRLYEEALWFIHHGAHREVVKFGIALLGLFHCDQDLDLLLTIGQHDEFTLFASVAIRNGIKHPNMHLFRLAQLVDGWGKIHIVERLEPETKEIKDWLLRKGCRNSIMYEYLAFICAEKGELHKALMAESIDIDLYHGAGDIISALFHDGPFAGIDDYDHAYTVLTQYLWHSRKLCKRSEELYAIVEIKRFLEQEESWKERYENGWTPEQRAKLATEVRSLLAKEKWEDMILQELRSEKNVMYYVVQIAEELSIDIWPALFERLKKDPHDDVLYFSLMRTTDLDRVRQLVRFVESTLPLEEVATGPALELGIGKNYHKFRIHRCLNPIVQELGRFEGIGIPLIQASLQSPVIGDRNLALNALEAWDESKWKQECLSLVTDLAQNDPDENVRQRAQKLIEKINKS